MEAACLSVHCNVHKHQKYHQTATLIVANITLSAVLHCCGSGQGQMAKGSEYRSET
jgi:hypothetical protein